MELPQRPRRGGTRPYYSGTTSSAGGATQPGRSTRHDTATQAASTLWVSAESARRHRALGADALEHDASGEDLTVFGAAMGGDPGWKQSQATREATQRAAAAQRAEDEEFRARLEELRLSGELQGGEQGGEGQPLWRDTNGGAPAPPVPLPPALAKRRPLTGAGATARGASSQSAPARTANQLEDALRRWLQVNRVLHESREVSLVRGLMSGADVDKNQSGVPRAMASPEAVRAASAQFKTGAEKEREARKAFEQGLRDKGPSGGPPSASDYASRVLAGPEEESEEDLSHLSEAQRYALKRRRAMERAAELRGDGPPLDLIGEGAPRSLHPDANPALRAGTSVAWGPPPVKQSYGAELASARYINGKAQGGIRQLRLTPEELMLSWELMSEGGEPSLGAPLSEKEAERLVTAHPDGFRVPLTSGVLQSRSVLKVASLVGAVLSESHASGKIRNHEGVPQMAGDLAECRIRYRPARTPAIAPTEFDAEAAMARSKEAPEFELRLEHCHGYSAHSNAAPNLFLTAGGGLVYYAAGLGVLSSVPRPRVQQEAAVAELNDELEALRASAISSARSLLDADTQPASANGEPQYHLAAAEPGGTIIRRGETSLWEGSNASREDMAETIMDELMDDMSEAGSRRSDPAGDARRYNFAGSGASIRRGETSLWEGSDVSREEVAETIMDELMDDMSEAGSRRSDPAAKVLNDARRYDFAGSGASIRRGETSLWEGSDVSREEVAETIMDELMDDMSDAGSRRSDPAEKSGSDSRVQKLPSAANLSMSASPAVSSPKPPLHRAASPRQPGAPAQAGRRLSQSGSRAPVQNASPRGLQSNPNPTRISRASAVSLESSRRAGRPSKPPQAGTKNYPHTKCFQEAPPTSQRFFTGHADDVTCIAIHPNGTTVATGELGKEPAICIWGAEGACKEKSRITLEDGSRGVAAAGFSGGKGKLLAAVALDNQHTVRVFDWATGRKIGQGIGQNGTPPQVYGITWDWYTGAGKEEGEERFVTWGSKHMKLWEVVQERHTAYAAKLCSFGQAPAQDVVCAAFLPPGLDAAVELLGGQAIKGNVPPAEGRGTRRTGGLDFNPNEGMIATGHPNGEVYFWRNRTVVKIIQAYDQVVRIVPKDGGTPTGHSGVRCIHLWQQGFPKHPCRAPAGRPHRSRTPEEFSHNDGAWVFLTGGDDGAVRMWDLGFVAEDGSAGNDPPAMLLPVYIPKAAGDSQAQAVRAIDLSEDGKVLYVGTHENDIWAFDLDLPATLADPSTATTGSLGATWYQANAACDASRATFADDSLNDRRLVAGSSKPVHAVAFHPQVPEVYAIGCDAPEVLVYHAGWRHPVGEPLFTTAGVQSIAFRNPDGQHIAIGQVDGGLEVFDRSRRRLVQHRQAREPVFDVKFSPSGAVLAASDGEQAIHLYNANKRYQRYAKCLGHSSSIVQVDFSADGAVLQSVCNAYEVMYWDVKEGRQLTQTQRDQQWATWTAKLGFSVMGIWPDEGDGSDINAVHAHQKKGLLVATDDSGNVRMYNYPCVAATPGCSIHRGHCSHVEMARFSCDGEVVVSVGGADCTALQWRVCRTSGEEGSGMQSGKAALEANVAALGPNNGLRIGGMAAGHMEPANGPLLAVGRGAVQGASSSIAQQMLSRGRESSSGYVKRRMAEMQEALNAELAKLDAKYAKQRGRPATQVFPPANKVWGATSASGRDMGWIDAPGAQQNPISQSTSQELRQQDDIIP